MEFQCLFKRYSPLMLSCNLTGKCIAIGNYSFRQTVPSTGSGTEADSSLRQATNSSLRQAQRAVRIASLRQAQRAVRIACFDRLSDLSE